MEVAAPDQRGLVIQLHVRRGQAAGKLLELGRAYLVIVVDAANDSKNGNNDVATTMSATTCNGENDVNDVATTTASPMMKTMTTTLQQE